MAKYLITGGCGFVGSNLAAEVLKRGEDLFVYDNLSRTGSSDNLKWLKGIGNFTFYQEDIRDSQSVEKVIKKVRPDYIFHLAGQVAMTKSIENPRLDFEINTLGTLNLLEAVRKYSKNSVIIYSSTNKVYGDLNWVKYVEKKKRYIAPEFPNGFDENIPLSFHSPYGCSKGAADQYLLDYNRIFGIRTIVFRHSSMYGGRQFATYDQGWIGWFCQKAYEIKRGKLKEPFTISGDGKQVRDLLYADDLVSLYFIACENSEKIEGEVFNIGGGVKNSLSILELFDILEEFYDIKLNFTKLPFRVSDQKIFIADITKIRRLTGWKPKVTKEDGIRNMVKWIEDING
jgi:CDP-paratose 2-epimerase